MEPCPIQTPDGWAVQGLPAFVDNYIWVVLSPDRKRLWAIDPGDPEPILQLCQKHGATLTDILITHHHGDHIGGIPALRQAFPGVRVVGPASEDINGLDQRLQEGDSVTIEGLNGCLRVLDVPGHTAGHIAYWLEPAQWLFCGDTLFAAGCGRLFEGTADQLYASLRKLGSLPPATLVFCTHEYTQSNLRYARVAEPANLDIRDRVEQVDRLRAAGEPTLPSSLGLEWLTNPFLRAADAAEFARLRREKDTFTG